MLFVADEAADDECFTAVHAHVSVRRAARDTVIFELADERGRADLGVHLGSHHFSIGTDNWCIGELDAGVKVFSGRVGAAAVMLFRLHGNVVANKDAGFTPGNGDNAGRGENFGFTVRNEGVERSVEAEGVAMPEFEVTTVAVAVIIVTAAVVIRAVAALRNCIPLPIYAEVLAVFAADGDDFGFKRDLLRGNVQLFQQALQLGVGSRRAAEKQAVGHCVLRELAWIEGLQSFADVLRFGVAQAVAGKAFAWSRLSWQSSCTACVWQCCGSNVFCSIDMTAVEGISYCAGSISTAGSCKKKCAENFCIGFHGKAPFVFASIVLDKITEIKTKL